MLGVMLGVMFAVMFALGVRVAVPEAVILPATDLLAGGGDGVDETLAEPLIEPLGEALPLAETDTLEETLGYGEGVVEPVVLDGVFVADREAELEDPREAVGDRVLLGDLVT